MPGMGLEDVSDKVHKTLTLATSRRKTSQGQKKLQLSLEDGSKWATAGAQELRRTKDKKELYS